MAKLQGIAVTQDSRRATIEAAGDEDENDVEAGPAAPPDDVDDAESDDEEGRFFGGGIAKGTAEILDYVEKQEAADAAVSNLLKPSDSRISRRIA